MATALTVYYCKVASSTLSTAGALASTTGGTLGNTDTTLGSNTGYGELSPFSPAAWAAAGSIGTPTGKGFLWDVTTLEGQQIIAGNWTPTVRLQLAGSGVTGTLTADVYVRVYRRGAGGLYTLIGTLSKTGNSITTTTTSFTFTAASLGAMNFNLGDKLYTDVWANVTANSATGGTALFRLYSTNTAGQGVSTAQIVTPGYQAQSAPSASFLAGLGGRHRTFGRIQ